MQYTWLRATIQNKARQGLLFVIVAFIAIASMGFFSPGQAHAVLPFGDAAEEILQWDLIYEEQVRPFQRDQVPAIVAIPPSENEFTEYLYSSPLDSLTNETVFKNGSQATITVDHCGDDPYVGIYGKDTDFEQTVRMSGESLIPACNEDEEDGSLRVRLIFDQFDLLLLERAVGPLTIQVLDGTFDIVQEWTDPVGIYQKRSPDDPVPDFTVSTDFFLSPGDYQVWVLEDGVLIGEDTKVTISEGIGSTSVIILNDGGSGINEIQYADKAIRAPCVGSGLGIGWLLCHATRVIFEGVQFLYNNIVIPLLDLEPLQQTNADGERSDLFQIWSNLRVISNILFVVIFLAAIFGAATSWLFSDYEIKRLIPRLTIGVIASQLSWYLVAFIVDSGNFLGAGIRGLLLSPAENFEAANFNITIFTEYIFDLLAIGGTVALFKSSVTARGVIMLLPLVLIPIVVALAIVVFVLAARHLLIVLVAVLSPIVFIIWALPGTDDIIKRWWNVFWKLIIMYPLIIALIAGGQLASKVIVADREGDAAFYLIGLIALFAPFFLIPATFSFAGGAIANVASGFDGMKKSVNRRLFGSPEPGSHLRGGYLYRVKDYQADIRQQRQFRNAMSSASFVRSARSRAGLPATGVGWRIFSKANRRKAVPYALSHIWEPGKGLTTGGLNRAMVNTRARLSSIGIDMQMAQRTIAAKKLIDALTTYQQDDIVHAMFGDYNLFTGERLPEWAIIEAREYRGDAAAQNAGLKYLVTQATTGSDWQKLLNHFAQWNPYLDNGVTLKPGEKLDADKHAAPGKKLDFEVYQSIKTGILKGATFGTQKERKDGKNRSLEKKHETYIEARGELLWGEPQAQAQAERLWQQEARRTGNTEPEPLSNNATTQEKADYQSQRKRHEDAKSAFFANNKKEFTEKYVNENKSNFGLVKDGAIIGGLGEITFGMDYTGQQLGSMFEMLSEASHRVQEIDEHFEVLADFAEKHETLQQRLESAKKTEGRNSDNVLRIESEIKRLEKTTEDTIGKTKTIDIKANDFEKIQYTSQLLGKNPEETTYEDYLGLSPEQKGAITRQKVTEWKDQAVTEVQRARNMAINVLESGSMDQRREEEDVVSNEPEALENIRQRQPWRVEEIERIDGFQSRVLNKVRPDAVRDIQRSTRASLEAEQRSLADGDRLSRGQFNRELERRVTDNVRSEFSRLETRADSDELIERAKREIHLDRVETIIEEHQPGAPLEQVQENINFIKISNWIERRGFSDD